MDLYKKLEKDYKIVIDTQNAVILTSRKFITKLQEQIKAMQELIDLQRELINDYQKVRPIIKIGSFVIGLRKKRQGEYNDTKN